MLKGRKMGTSKRQRCNFFQFFSKNFQKILKKMCDLSEIARGYEAAARGERIPQLRGAQQTDIDDMQMLHADVPSPTGFASMQAVRCNWHYLLSIYDPLLSRLAELPRSMDIMK